ncbi:hypothetical protein PtA15_11A375 [Puccinia triticina]|uniref:Uncharacterized protein n=1 Tax=Puccinia triticina TaxID=208348 RepID=A0ABY7CWK7_9BASI|nr:uncharacterized protein PtA15_11A375 [Puccinia triticina]WAQ89684.1 hypothetical protein PtA15_11A375 [Puccinia triticina]
MASLGGQWSITQERINQQLSDIQQGSVVPDQIPDPIADRVSGYVSQTGLQVGGSTRASE